MASANLPVLVAGFEASSTYSPTKYTMKREDKSKKKTWLVSKSWSFIEIRNLDIAHLQSEQTRNKLVE